MLCQSRQFSLWDATRGKRERASPTRQTCGCREKGCRVQPMSGALLSGEEAKRSKKRATGFDPCGEPKHPILADFSAERPTLATHGAGRQQGFLHHLRRCKALRIGSSIMIAERTASQLIHIRKWTRDWAVIRTAVGQVQSIVSQCPTHKSEARSPVRHQRVTCSIADDPTTSLHAREYIFPCLYTAEKWRSGCGASTCVLSSYGSRNRAQPQARIR